MVPLPAILKIARNTFTCLKCRERVYAENNEAITDHRQNCQQENYP